MSSSILRAGFLDSPVGRDLSDAAQSVVVLGVPFDLATTGRSGARLGPDAMRTAAAHVDWEKRRWPWPFELRDRVGLLDYGDVHFPVGNSGAMVAELQALVREILAAGKTLLSLGGDHFVTLPILREHAARHGPVALVHFDAHADTERVEGDHNHGNMFWRAHQEGLVDAPHSVQVGIRTEYEIADHPFTVLDAAWVNEHSAEEAAATIERVVGGAPAYLTFDIDCLDPAFAPGTGTPAPGGITTERALSILRGLRRCNIVGMDVVEVAPAYDHAEVTALAAVSIALEILHAYASRPDDRLTIRA